MHVVFTLVRPFGESVVKQQTLTPCVGFGNVAIAPHRRQSTVPEWLLSYFRVSVADGLTCANLLAVASATMSSPLPEVTMNSNQGQVSHTSAGAACLLRACGMPLASSLAALVISAAPAAAQPVSALPWMTGQQFVELAAWPEDAHSGIDLTPQQAMNQELARMFLVGVHDATEGKDWCYSQRAKPKPDTLQDQAVHGLRAMNPKQLKRSAAVLVVEVWRAKYPCTTGRKKS
ncbi:MAG: Rap1a/Tai family immunity protein [Pseudomonadota bacterium]